MLEFYSQTKSGEYYEINYRFDRTRGGFTIASIICMAGKAWHKRAREKHSQICGHHSRICSDNILRSNTMAVGDELMDKSQLIELLVMLQFKCLKEQDYTIVN